MGLPGTAGVTKSQPLSEMQPDVETLASAYPQIPSQCLHLAGPSWKQLKWEPGKLFEGDPPHPYSAEQSREG